MGFMGAERSTLLFILVATSMFSVSFAGRQHKFHDELMQQMGSEGKESPMKLVDNKEVYATHPRNLKVRINDYGSYDPAPTFAMPTFKLINN